MGLVKFFLFLNLMCHQHALAQTEVQKITLNVGESVVVPLEGVERAKVSRKGVVHLFFNAKDNHWVALGLKAGLVMIENDDPLQMQKNLLLIEVVPLKNKDSSGETPSRNLEELRWICDISGVSCRLREGLIVGNVTNYREFELAKAACLSTKECVWRVDLASESKEAWAEELQAKLHHLSKVEILRHGTVKVSSSCAERKPEQLVEEINQRTGGLIRQGLGFHECLDDAFREQYEVHAKVQKRDLKTVRAQGVPGESQMVVGHHMDPVVSLIGGVGGSDEGREAKIIAQPRLGLGAWEASEVKIGSELMFVRGGGRHSKVEWKEIGLNMKLKLHPVADKSKVYVHLDLSLRDKGSTASELSLSQVANRFLAPLGEFVWAGSLDLDSRIGGHANQLFLAEIPIIGILFRQSQDQKSDSQLEVFLRIKKK